MVKVNVVEQPACRRVLEIEIPADEVESQLDAMVQEYRQSMQVPGFRKGKAPVNMVRAQMADKIESEFLKRALPRAYMEAVEESRVQPASDPEIKDLSFRKGEPLRFAAHIEVWPEVTVQGYRELSLVREENEIDESDIDRTLENLRQSRATYNKVDRPAQGGDLIGVEYWVLDSGGQRGEMKAGTIELGGEGTPEPFNQALMGVNAGESRRAVLPATSHTTEHGVHEHPAQVFDILIREISERDVPPADDAFARGALGNENAGLSDLRARIRLNLEAEERFRSHEAFEDVLFDELINRNPFDVPEGIVKGTLDDIVDQARKDRGSVSDDEERELRAAYLPAVEKRLKTDILIQAVGRQENLVLEEEEVDAEIARMAEREKMTAVEVKGSLRKNDRLDRFRDGLYRRKVMNALLGLARIDVIKKRR